MDEKLIAWARQVKSRQRVSAASAAVPVLWLFSDPVRLPDPRPAASRLPRGLCGVVLRHDRPACGAAERAQRLEAGRKLASVCRDRRLALQVAGDRWLAQALGAGIHFRRGRGWRVTRPALLTSSAHDCAELRRAWRAGAPAVFLSPCFPTASHPEVRVLRPLRWSAVARQAGAHGVKVLALGGITGVRARALPRDVCAGAGSIESLK